MALKESSSEPQTVERSERPRPPLSAHRLVRAGVYTWAVIGVLVLAAAVVWALSLLTIVVVPLVLALFPAAVLMPLVRRLTDRRVPPALTALIVLLAALGLVTGLLSALAPQVQQELGNVGASLQQGYAQIESFLADGPFGLAPIQLDELITRAWGQVAQADGLGATTIEALNVVVESFTGFLLLLFALFFYLKDGAKIGAWLRSLFPAPAQDDAEHIGGLVWHTIGGYIRGQLLIAFVDAALIGIGLLILRVPLALPLAVFVFFGALFPIVGAIVAGAMAVLVALATGGVASALLVLALIGGVQQLEGHILAPVLLGRATQLHPLAVIAALTAGWVLLGVLGAFLSVPIAASVARVVGYLRQRLA